MRDLFPTTEAEAAAIILKHNETRQALAIAGGNTRSGLGNPVKAESRLRSTAISGIVTYNPGEMVITARAGTPVSEIEAALAENDQMMAFEPMDHRRIMRTGGEPTIGGVFAANVSGPRRFVAGAARDSLLGIRFVNGKGEVIKAGGRVMKNVTGLDLVKLLAGSHGTLGLLTEVTFRVPPRHRAEETVVVCGLGNEVAARAMAAAMALTADISGAAHLPENIARLCIDGLLPDSAATVFRIEGLPKSVAVRSAAVSEALKHFGRTQTLGREESSKLWEEIRDVAPFSDGSELPIWRISVAPSEGSRLVEHLEKRLAIDAFFDWQGGLVWVRTDERPSSNEVRAVADSFSGGHATLVRASEKQRREVPSIHPPGKTIELLSARIKSKFDPLGILNPGFL